MDDTDSHSASPSPDLFDADFYLACYGETIPPGTDPLDDYLERGWRLGYDPSPKFSTTYYLERNPDVVQAGFNPLVHYVLYGREEGRRPAPFTSTVKNSNHRPSVSVIVPVYNHAPFLPQRISSILDQNYEDLELIILDDASTDNSVEVVESLLADVDISFRIVRNAENSGAVFRQWEKGLKLARGEVVWICESDDYCDPGFLKEIVPLFADDSVMLAFGDIQFCDVEGNRLEGLDGYRESAERGIWNTTLVRPASEWFRHGFGVRNVIPNVGGCVFRNQSLSDEEWSELRQYRIVGDWYFYLTVARGGRIAYEPAALAYFRQHGTNTSVRSFAGDGYYLEHQRIAESIARQWGPSRPSATRLGSNLRDQYDRFYPPGGTAFSDLFDVERVAATPRRQKHVLICMLGFYVGGGELFPILLANLLVRRGIIVSMLIMKTVDPDAQVRARLDKRVAVYDVGIAEDAGKTKFLAGLSVDIIHSHNVLVDMFFFHDRKRVKTPYVVTLHGSYELMTLSAPLLKRIGKGVHHWVYLTERNLRHLGPGAIAGPNVSRIPNAAEISEASPPFTRRDLGISPDAFVFTVISRALKEKGWEQTALAFQQVAASSDRELHLIFCGTGATLDELKRRFASSNIHFLGFQADPHGIYRLSDCAVLASRFGGESYPLTLVEALQVSRPIICTDVGECRTILESADGNAGLLIQPDEDDDRFVTEIAGAMTKMLRPELYRELAMRADIRRGDFDPERMVEAYLDVYAAVLATHSSSKK